jgi:uncharacterized protein (TIGR02246 family)
MPTDIRALYDALIAAWNRRDAAAIAALFAPEGQLVGFDGSQVNGAAEIAAHLAPIFASHPTPPFTTVVRGVRALGPDAAILSAVAGMAPPGQADLKPELNAVQTLVAARRDGAWRIEMFQNTPAALHGRPEAVAAMTAELRDHGKRP